MTDEQKNLQPEITPEAEVLYTESFARERTRRSRRGSLFFGMGAMIYGCVVVHDAVIAVSTGKLVSLGGGRHGIDLPPFLAGPIGVIASLVGLSLLTSLIFRRK